MLDHNLVLPNRIVELAAKRPDEPAMVDVAGRTATYAELRDTAWRWAAAYRRVGVSDRKTVVTMLPNSFEAYYAWLGVAWLRGIEVPANNMYRGHMLQYLIENSEAEVLVISERFVDRLDVIAGSVPKLRTVVIPDASGALPDLPFEVVAGTDFLGDDVASDLTEPEPWDIAALIYTSGTTGPSKGVLVPWGELCEGPRAMPENFIVEGGAYYTVYPAFHLSGKVGLYTSAFYSARLIIRETFSPADFWNDVREHDVHSMGLLGPMAAMLLMMPEQPDDADNPVDNVMMGPIIPNIEEFQRRFGIQNIGTGYGMTEIGFPLASGGYDLPNAKTCGRRREGYPGYEVKVVDEHDREVGPNEVGELVVRSFEPWVMNAGYWGMPDKTAEAWRNGWFHTGDGFMYDEDGNFYFVDRMKDALRRRGENISSFEVEAGINQHPAVQETAVIAVPSELGEDEVKAVCVVAAGQSVTPEELIEFLIPRMPRFMIPRYLEFVDALPKTDATFRVRKVELRENAINENTWDREKAGIKLPKD